MKIRRIRALFILSLGPCLQAIESDLWLDRLDDNLAWASGDQHLRLHLSGSFELEAYAFEGPPPGVLDTSDQSLFQPRLTLFLDGQAGNRWYGFAQARFDRGFDPADHGVRGRLDEVAVRYTPFQSGSLNLQAGQFATLIGGWVHRHLPRANPFVTAPLPYEHITRLSDLYPPYDTAKLADELDRDRKYYYNPIIWGPAYTSGVAVSGRSGQLEWALEFKNASPFSRPSAWSLSRSGFGAPTWSGRLNWRPDIRWQVGVSASDGSYLVEDGWYRWWGSRRDYRQRLVLVDFSYALHHLEIWGEWMQAEFETPRRPELRANSGFLEARYRFTAGFSAAARYNEMRFSGFHDNNGADRSWGETVRRIDLAGTWRLTAHARIKLELNLRSGEDGLDGTGWGGAAQFSVAF